MANYTVKSYLGGRHTVNYECGRCGLPLASPLGEAGQTFPCPTCGTMVGTPGKVELEKQQEDARAQQLQERRSQELRQQAAKSAAAAAAKVWAEAELLAAQERMRATKG